MPARYTNEEEDDKGIQFDFDLLIKAYFSGVFDRDTLPQIYYDRIAGHLIKALQKGLARGGGRIVYEDTKFLQQLSTNVHQFAAAKTYAQGKELTAALKDSAGNLRTFTEFKEAAKEITDTFNKTWLNTEYNLAVGQAHQASEWQRIEEDVQLFPYLVYDTVGDGNVRDTHKALEGVCRPVGDPFWNTHAPLNGWGCRCRLKQVDAQDAKPTPDNALPTAEASNIPEMFRYNPGKSGTIYPKDHPYFDVEPEDRALAARNFDLLPSEGDATTK